MSDAITTPPTTSEWLSRYLVVEWTTKSAPRVIGFCNADERNVLSTATLDLTAFARFAMARISTILISGLLDASWNTHLVSSHGGAAAVSVQALKVFTLAESLGGIESLIAHPATMTHASMSADTRQRAGIEDTLLRLSVGLEAEDDLSNDLKRGFSALSDG
jgi:hypothetical protein